jgi:hypothetical protein
MKARSLVCGLPILVLACLAVAGSGCVSSRVLHHDDLRPGDTFTHSVVFLQGGGRYEFRRVAVFPDTVVGEYQITVERSAVPTGVYWEEETHAHRMALAMVDSVAVLRRDPVKTLIYTAGAAGIGYLMYEALDSSNSGKGSTANRKSAGPPS